MKEKIRELLKNSEIIRDVNMSKNWVQRFKFILDSDRIRVFIKKGKNWEQREEVKLKEESIEEVLEGILNFGFEKV